MLTEQERKWLKQRDRNLFSFGLYLAFTPGMSPALIDYRDAAEFEARVAVVAANGAQPCLQYDYNCPYGYAGDCPDNCDGNYNRFGTQATRCGLKHARLYVEEEMDNERNLP